MTYIRIANQVQDSSICTLKISEKISQLVNFKLFPCDLSPPLKLAVGGFSKDDKMSYTHLVSISSVAMGYRRKEEDMRKDPFEIFGSIDLDLSTSSLKSSNSNILVSTHPIGKMEIVPESLNSR